ncbi:MAG: disulfide oxidoreductase [Gemmatimonadota bacterium]
MTLYATLITLLAGASLLAGALALALGATLLHPAGRASLVQAFAGRARHPIAWAWVVALVASLGSLYLSEVVGFVPCVLCWYQRIAMYPLVIVLGVAALRDDASVWRYAMPLSVVGLLIAIYHVTIQLQPSLDVGVCSAGATCTGRYLAVFGFVSIPVMAGMGFLLVGVLLMLLRSLETMELEAMEHEAMEHETMEVDA